MKKIYSILLAMVLLAPLSSAWGPVTKEYFCSEVVSSVWGGDKLYCLDQPGLCDLVKFKGDVIYGKCLKSNVVPVLLPDLVFNDSGNHVSYHSCPLSLRDLKRDVVCGVSNESPARDDAEYWFSKASEEVDLCDRIQLTCIGVSYLADSEYPLNQVKHLVGCLTPLDEGVDERIRSSESNWSVSSQCSFAWTVEKVGRSVRDTYHHTFKVTDGDVTTLVDYMVSEVNSSVASRVQQSNESYLGVELVSVVAPEGVTVEQDYSMDEESLGVNLTEEDLLELECQINESLEAIEDLFGEVTNLLEEIEYNQASADVDYPSTGNFTEEYHPLERRFSPVMIVFACIILLSSVLFLFYVMIKGSSGEASNWFRGSYKHVGKGGPKRAGSSRKKAGK